MSTNNAKQVQVMGRFLQGLSAYEVAVKNGFEGTEEEWLKTLELLGLPAATATTLGGVQADPLDGVYSTPVKIGSDNKLYIPSVRPFRLIRDVTIPEDITTDTTGVKFAAANTSGYMFAFDTDYNGNPFELTDLLISTNAASDYSGVVSLNIAIDHNTPTWTNTSGWTVSVSCDLDVGGSGAFKKSMGMSFLTDDLYSTSIYGSWGGGKYNNVQSKNLLGAPGIYGQYVKFPIQMMRFGVTAAYGFLPGSTFRIYGR